LVGALVVPTNVLSRVRHFQDGRLADVRPAAALTYLVRALAGA